ncbi:hypothetical protein JZ751_000057 [Albula glossodonta]|uniref:inositol-phosphate phosphatase n=1 Tax=Albula glossodonta TaxID=121402 RepID=A0A8T2PV32_9TELE|nr:hypothetical protein JZ751_000057 [Albula glossodonta]
MAPMGIRLSPLGVVVFCLLGVGIIYHLYAGVISSRIAAMRKRRTVDMRELLALSVEAAVRGGHELKRIREDSLLEDKSKGNTKEGANEKLTSGDLLSHRKMYHLIKNTFPYIQVNSGMRDDAVGEETAAWNHVIPADMQQIGDGKEVAAEEVTVWINPLDASQEYAENLRKYVTTMVCVAVNGAPVVGVIHKPFTEYTAQESDRHTWMARFTSSPSDLPVLSCSSAWAMVGAGSNVRARSAYGEKSPQVIVSRSHAGKVNGFIQTAFGNDTVIRVAGGAGYKVLTLLDPSDDTYEKADMYLHITYIKKWDICAGNAILKALGGHMTNLKGEEIDYRGAEANNGGVLASIERGQPQAEIKRPRPAPSLPPPPLPSPPHALHVFKLLRDKCKD